MFFRRAKSLLSKVLFFIPDHRWILLSVSMGALGIATVWIVVPFIVNLVFATGTVMMLILELRQYLRVRGEIHFAIRSADDFSDVQEQLEDNARFDFLRLPNVGTFVVDNAMSAATDGGTVLATLAPERYKVAPEVVEFGGIFRRRAASGVDFYDGQVLGLKSNIGDGDSAVHQVTLVPATYSDHLATDIFAMHDVYAARQFRGEFGRKLFIDRKGTPRDFGSSWLLNAVGTSSIAVSTDGRVIAVNQSTKNQSSGGLLAPSSSGSLEPIDFCGRTEVQFKDVLAVGALRELKEETGISGRDVAGYSFLGFGRWLDKAAKPEAFTLVFLTIDSHTALRRVIPLTDRPFSLGKQALRINVDTPNWSPERSGLILEDDDARRRLSLPMLVGLAMMTSAVRDPKNILSARIREYLN